MLVEVCANSYQSARNAQIAGAHRIELCSELAVGGITPSYGLIKQVVCDLKIPVFVLIRPRSGNFTYSQAELDIMLKDIAMCKELGCAGIVSGVLHADNTLDIQATSQLIEAAKPLKFTFHRAFDWVPQPKETLQQLIDLGVHRVLTSGQEASAANGIALLKQLQTIATNKIVILPGGGINSENAKQFKLAGCHEIHVSATQLETVMDVPKLSLNSLKFFNETQIATSHVKTIAAIIEATT